MIEKKQRIIFTFEKTTHVIKTEMKCKDAGMPGRVIPVPTAISAGCGLCFMADIEYKDELILFMEKENIEIENTYEMML